MSVDYFKGINYSMANEDTSLEVELVKRFGSKKALSICGSGGRFLPLFQNGLEKVFYVDLSQEQLYVAQLREACYHVLTHTEFLQFWGYPPYSEYNYSYERKALFKRLPLSKQVKEFFLNIFEANQWHSILYTGKWESTFNTFSKFVRPILGKDYGRIFEFHNLDDQWEYYRGDFPYNKWKFVIFALGNRAVFNALLYKGDFIEKNVSESHFEYYWSAFERLIKNNLVRDSFFMHLCFHGKITHPDGNTIEAKNDNYLGVQQALKNTSERCIPLNRDIFSAVTELEGEGIDFVSYSDVPSYFRGEVESNFLQNLKPCLRKGAHVVVRSYLRVPQGNYEDFEDISEQFEELFLHEKVQMYRVQVFRYDG